MTLPVRISPEARDQLAEHARWWSENRSAAEADRWLVAISDEIVGIGEHPRLHGLTAEDAFVTREIRELFFGLGRRPSHRVLYSIEDTEIVVFAVRHVARGPMSSDELL